MVESREVLSSIRDWAVMTDDSDENIDSLRSHASMEFAGARGKNGPLFRLCFSAIESLALCIGSDVMFLFSFHFLAWFLIVCALLDSEGMPYLRSRAMFPCPSVIGALGAV